MFKLQHQFNNIAETVQTTQLTNDQMPEFHCHGECLKCPPTAPRSNTSLQSLNLRSVSPSCRSVLVVGCPWSDSLSSAIVFGFVLSLQ